MICPRQCCVQQVFHVTGTANTKELRLSDTAETHCNMAWLRGANGGKGGNTQSLQAWNGGVRESG